MSATRERDLRTGRPLWARSAATGVPVRTLTAAISVDVAIVGAGISGALMALELGKGRSVAVLDRRPPLQGSTLASTALLQWEIDLPLTALADRIGQEKARRAYVRSARAVSNLKSIVAEERIRCGFYDRSTLYLAGDAYGHRALKVEAEARSETGLPSAYLNAGDLRDRYGLERTGAILSQGSAAADPAQLTAALLRRAADRGAAIYSPVEVVDVLSDPSGVTLVTDTGHVVRAGSVVFCSGYEFPVDLGLPGAQIASTWAIASEPGVDFPAWLRDTLVWEASDPYLYLRTTGEGRLIIGGEDEESATAHASLPKLEQKARAIRRKLGKLLPEVDFRIERIWAGAFGDSTTGLPSIRRIPGMDHAWAVQGFGGNGITYSVIASQIVGAALRGRPDPDADLYA